MKYVHFLASFIISAGLICYLNGNIFNSGNLPPFGKLLNPFTGIWANTASKGKAKDTVLRNNNLTDEVEIIIDEHGIPHIYASNMADAMYAQGYMEAKERLFQMDMTARAAAGRISEVAGPSRLSFDIAQRKKGLHIAAENALKGWKKFEENKRILQPYVEGINTAINELSPEEYPLEYKLLNAEPEAWTQWHSALIAKIMANDLAGRSRDLANTNTFAMLGKERFFDIFSEHQAIETPVISDDFLPDLPSMRADTAWSQFNLEAIPQVSFEKPKKGIGSNNWALMKERTKNGYPLMASDPHLMLGLPSIWYQLYIHIGDKNACGVSIPGMPGIMMGYNDDIAWGETNVGQDIKDYFKIRWVDDSRTAYYLDGKKTAVEIREEIYHLKGGGQFVDTIYMTAFGPIQYESDDAKNDLAVRWLAHDEPKTNEAAAFVHAITANSYDDYLKATEGYIAPAQNFLAASKHNEIGIRVNGRFAQNNSQDGRFIQHGDQSANNWQNYIEKKHNPQMKNPERGWVASSNQVSASRNYPYYFTGGFEAYRNRTIDSLLSNNDQATVQDMMDMQNSNFSMLAEDMLPLLISHIDLAQQNNEAKQAITLLQNWDYDYDANQVAPSYFDIWSRSFYKMTWDEIYQHKEEYQMAYPSWWRTVALLEQEANHNYFDILETPAKETARELAQKSFETLLEKISEAKQENKSMKWTDYKPLNIYHLLQIPALSKTNLKHNGCGDALNANTGRMGPSWRQVVELKDKPQAWGIYPGGQSGNPLSNHYDNFLPIWLDGEYLKIDLYKTKEEIKGQRITLKP